MVYFEGGIDAQSAVDLAKKQQARTGFGKDKPAPKRAPNDGRRNAGRGTKR